MSIEKTKEISIDILTRSAPHSNDTYKEVRYN